MSFFLGNPISGTPDFEDAPDIASEQTGLSNNFILGKPINGTPDFEEEKGDFIPGIKRGIDQTQASLYGATALVGSAVGSESVKKWGMEGYKRNMAEAQENPAEHSFKDVYTGNAGIGGSIIGGSIDWAQGMFGELIPSMVEAAIGTIIGTIVAPGPGSVAGGFASRTILKKSIENITKEAVESQISKGIIKEAARSVAEEEIKKQVTKQALLKLGGKVGMGAAVLPLESGGNYAQLLDEKGIDAPGTALFFGALSTSLEYAGGNSKLVDKFIDAIGSGGSAVKSAAKELITNIPEEALQEGGQEVFSILNTVVNTDEKLLTAKNLEQIIESMGAGAIGGLGGASLSIGMDAISKDKPTNLLDKTKGFSGETVTDQPEPSEKAMDDFQSGIATSPVDQYSDTIPFAGVPNEEELGWMDEINRQRNPSQQAPPPSSPPPDMVQDRYAENQQAMAGIESEPDYSITKSGINESKNLLEKNIDTLKRVQSRERSVSALGERQQAMGQSGMYEFQRGLEAQPEEPTGKYLPFARLGDMLGKNEYPQAINPVRNPATVNMEQGTPEYIDPQVRRPQTNRVTVNMEQAPVTVQPEETAMQGVNPVFEHEVEPDKINTNPSEAQKEAGNYQKDHIKIDGLNITIENPHGSTRKGTDKSGKQWESTMSGHYGYFKRTEGKDGDQVDVIVNPGTETSPKVFVVDQVDPKSGKFDEHKVIMGTSSEREARDLYLSNYEEGWQGLGAITEMNQPVFKEWLKDGERTKKPLAVSLQGSVPVVDKSADLSPGQAVTWKTKKGEELKGELIIKTKNMWQVKKPDGEKTFVLDKDLSLNVSENVPVETTQKEDQAIKKFVDSFLESEIAAGKKRGYAEATQEQIDKFRAYQTERTKAFAESIRNKDFQVLQDRLHRGNPSSLKLFSEITGLSTKTQKETDESIRSLDSVKYDQWVKDKKQKFDDTVKEKEAARKEKAEKDMLSREVVYLGGRMTWEKYINALLEGGYTDVDKKENGPFQSLKLLKNSPDGRTFSSETFKKKAEIEYIERLADQYSEKAIAEDIAKEEKDMAENPDKYTSKEDLDHLFGKNGKSDTLPKEDKKSITDFFLTAFRSGKGFANILQARKALADETGFIIKAGTQDAKMVDEAIETAGVRAARAIIDDGRKHNGSSEQIFDKLVDLQNRMPNLSVRTSTSVRDQAYSTPLPLAWVASELAGITSDKTVYEPSAGNGALLIGSNPEKVTANELNPDRHNTLLEMGFDTYNADGTQISAGGKVDAVIGNPPFGVVKDDAGVSKTWKINDQYSTTQIDHAIVFKALESMKDNGRAVFIVGSVNDKNITPEARKLLYRAKDKVLFYKTLFDNYNVVDHFSLSGDLYAKQGAAWPVDFIAIDGKGKSKLALPGAVPPPYFKTLEELKGKLDGKTTERPDSLGTSRGELGAMDSGGMAPEGGDPDAKLPQAPDDRPGSEPDKQSGRSPGSGKDAGKGPGERRPVTGRDDVPEIDKDGGLGSDVGPDQRTPVSSPVDDGDSRQPADKPDNGDQPGSGRDSKADGSGNLDREPGLTDEFSPENLLAEWDNQAAEIAVKEKVQEAKAHFSNAIDKFKKINKLLGERGSFSTEKTDENVYQEIKTLLQEALDDLLMAGKAAKDFVKLAIENLSPKARPYFERFVKTDMVISKKAEAQKQKPKPKEKAKASSGQVPYIPSSKSPAIETLTPVNMSEAIKKALADINEKHGLVDDYVSEKLGYTNDELREYFSGEQVDAIALAINNIDKGAGFIIGDQTGVGKGRVVAAMIRFAMERGLTPIFVTEKPNLYTDMYRDLSDIGMSDMADRILITNANEKISLTEDGDKAIRTTNKHNSILKQMADNGFLDSKYSAIFTTYDQTNKPGSAQRVFLEAMAEKNGMLILDEAHKAGGSEGAQETNEKYPRSIWFRRLIQSAHSTFYSSATYAKRPSTMDLYSKTDMRLAVDDIKDLSGAIAQGGVPLQQAVAAMLVEAGQYVRRERSFDGVEYATKATKIDQVRARDVSISLNQIKKFSEEFIEPAIAELADQGAFDGTGIGGMSAAAAPQISSVSFASTMHNLISQMLLSLKTQAAVDEAIYATKEIKTEDGKKKKESQKPVITLSNTMGSFIEQYVEDNGLKPGDGIGLKFNDLLFKYLDNTRRYTEKRPFGKKSETIHHYITDADLGPEGVKAFARVKKMIFDMDLDGLPVSPVDYMISKLKEAGLNASEITGRNHMIEYRPDGSQRYRMRSGKDKSIAGRTKTIFDFNTDKTDVLILNQSGATGLSLHAVPKWEGHDPKPRVMIIAQAEANIDTHMQMLGRIHRAGQVKTPSYIQLMGDIPSEKRPAAVLAGKMASLNANTTASKDSEVTAKDVVDFINKYGDKVVAGLMADFPEMHTAIGSPLKNSDRTESGLEEEGAARKVTGRVPLLPTIKEQEDLYALIEEGYTDLIDQLDAMGENDLEAKTFDTDAKTLKKATVFDGKGGKSPFTSNAFAEEVDMKKIGKSYSSEEVVNLLKENIFGLDSKEARTTEKSLNELANEGRDKHYDKSSDVLNRFLDYRNGILDDIEDEERLRAQSSRLDAIRDDWERVFYSSVPGSILEIPIGDTYFETVVLGVEQKGNPKNPLSLGTWKVTVAVPDSTRKLVVPFSFINRMESFSNNGKINESVLSKFDRSSQSARETRVIMTGNLLAAFARYPKGRIINFTDDKGRVRQGILMPAKFDLNKESQGRPITLTNAKDIMTVLSNNIFVRSRRGDLSITPKQDGSGTISVPAAKASGSRYYLNSGLLDAVGSDFVKSGNRMKVSVQANRMKRALDHLINSMEEVFENVADSMKVMNILGLKAPEFAETGKESETKQAAEQPTDQQDGKAKFSTQSDGTPGKGVSLQDIQSRLKDQDVSISPDGSISIRLKNGLGLTIKSVQSFEGEDISLAIQTGRMTENGVILGKYQSNEITLNQDLATNFTRDHELYHFLKSNGLISKSDGLVLIGAMKKMSDTGFKISKDVEENEANTFAKLLSDREKYRGTVIGRIIQKVSGFVDGLLHIGRQSSGKIAREVESGEIFGKEVTGEKSYDTQLSVTDKTGKGDITTGSTPQPDGGEIILTKEQVADLSKTNFTDFPKELHTLTEVVDKDGSPRIVYHGTDKKFDKFANDEQIYTANPSTSGDNGLGIFFTSSKGDAEYFAGGFKSNSRKGNRVVEAFLDIRAPFLVKHTDNLLHQFGSFQKAKKYLIDNGYDGIHVVPEKGSVEWWIVFDANDIYVRQKTDQIWKQNVIEGLSYSYLGTKGNVDKLIKRFSDSTALKKEVQFLKSLKESLSPNPTSTPGKGVQKQSSFSTSGDVFDEKFGSDPTIKETLSELVDKAKSKDERGLAMDRLVTKTLDRLHPIKKLGDASYKLHRMLSGVKTATFSMFLEHGPLSWVGNTLTVKDRNKGVIPFLKSIGPDWKNLLYWVAAKRAEQLEAEGRENWLDKKSRDEIFAKVGTHSKDGESWASLNLRFQTVNKNVLDVAEQAGLINPEARSMWESNFYVPFYRIFEDEVTKQEFLSGPHRSKQHISAQIKKLKGGEAKIGDLVENVLTNWMSLIDASVRNKARATAFEAGQQLGIIEEVEKKELVKVLGSETIKRYAVVKEGAGKARDIFDTQEEAEAWAYDLEDQGKGKHSIEPRTTYKVVFGSMKDRGILSFQRNGESVYFKTDDIDLFEALSEMDTKAFNNVFMRMMGGAKRVLSYAATFGPAFRIRNMIRDTVHTAVVAKSFMPVLDTARGFLKAMTEDQDYIEYMASGFGFGASYVNADDPKSGARFLKNIIRTEGHGALRRILDPARPWDNIVLRLWEKIGSSSENAARLGLYTNLKKKGMSNFDAGFEGRDLMDFSMHGSSQTVQILTRIIPFLNARFQALYKLGRSSRENPKAFLLKSAILTTASLALWSLFKDDERYKQLEDWDKWTYFHFWLGEDHYRIPKPFEIGALFCSLPESIANVQNGTEEGKFVWDWFKFTAGSVFNIDTPQLIKPVIEERFNMNTFKGNKIVPDSISKLSPSEQYQPWTSDTMRMVGGALNISPLKLQHYVNGYFSTIGSMVLFGTDIVSRKAMGYPARPEGERTPFDIGIAESGDPRSTKYNTRFYKLYEEMESTNQTFSHLLKTGQKEKAKEFLAENKGVMRLKEPANQIRSTLSIINEETKKVQSSKTLTAEEKKAKIDELNKKKNDVTKRLFEAIRKSK